MTSSFSFSYGPKLVSGSGATLDMARLLPDAALLFVTDANMRALGLCDAPIAALEAAGRAITIFDAVEADPSEETVLAAVAAGRAASVHGVVGFGGGSPMDVAKLAAYLLGSNDDLTAIYGVDMARGEKLPLVLVPTTAGTGSEATPISIITIDGNQKKGVVAPALYADWALLDAELTVGLPPGVTAATGVDAMVHAIEAYTSVRFKNPLSDMFSRQALTLLAANIGAVVNDGMNIAARQAMLLGSHLAGIAFANAPVAGVHALAYPLGGHFHVPHGLSNALMLPHVLRHNMTDAMGLYAELGPLIDPGLMALGRQAQAQGLVEALMRIAADSGLPDRLAAVGVSAADLDQLADDAMLQTRLLVNNPSPITREDARRLYAAAL